MNEFDNKYIVIMILVLVCIFELYVIMTLQHDTNRERVDRVDHYLEEYDKLCYADICVSEDNTLSSVRMLWLNDGYGYKTYKEFVTNAALSCICDGSCVTLEGYAE